MRGYEIVNIKIITAIIKWETRNNQLITNFLSTLNKPEHTLKKY